jgi:isoleucyl-tRNA synthetase
LYDFDPAKHTVPEKNLTGLDRWILDEYAKMEAAVLRAYDDYEFHVVYQKLSQFVAVELSAIYHDVVKDRLYTDSANSARRRSTQTALHTLVSSLCKALAPMLAFTADEAWEFVRARGADSVHQAEWHHSHFQMTEEERGTWKALFHLRELALPELEKARQAKHIGKALEAKLTIAGPVSTLQTAKKHQEDLRELLNVSQLEINPTGDTAVSVTVSKAAGEKCERCWHWETDVGASKEHPTLCGRCVKAITAS